MRSSGSAGAWARKKSVTGLEAGDSQRNKANGRKFMERGVEYEGLALGANETLLKD